jgi:hypothetical protein
MAYEYKNAKGRSYYLHRLSTSTGKSRYVFKRDPDGETAVDDVPEGYVVRESVNGQVSLCLAVDDQHQPGEVEKLRDLLEQEPPAKPWRLDVRADHITVYIDEAAPGMQRMAALLGVMGMSGMDDDTSWRRPRFEPVVRFSLTAPGSREYYVERQVYSGREGWSRPLSRGSLVDLARYVIPHLGEDSFFELGRSL